uniref:Tubulin folding cofactor E n=1 Tax=Cyprinodon variegatus TaxID=28743 RepID=A0A3Q2ED92_CYPVA
VPLYHLWVCHFRFATLSSVLLNHCEVNGAGEAGEIRRRTPNVKWLDLSRSLLSKWEDVAAITEQLEQLRGLELCDNRLSLTSDPWAHQQAFRSLKVLALNSCSITWLEVRAFTFPPIVLCEPYRMATPMPILRPNRRPESATAGLSDSNKTMFLLFHGRLEQLNLSETGLSSFQLEDADQALMTSQFVSVFQWRVINDLTKLPDLVKLSCRNNKLLSRDGNLNTVNQMIIAKLGQLLYLNNSEINPAERKGAELDYIKMFGEEWLKAGGPGQPSVEFTLQHPTYQRLIQKYGAADEGELKKPEPFALKNQLLSQSCLLFLSALQSSMVIQKVKGLLYRLLKVPVSDLRLTYTSPKMPGTEFDLDSDLKTLQFYSIENGDQVLVRWS